MRGPKVNTIVFKSSISEVELKWRSNLVGLRRELGGKLGSDYVERGEIQKLNGNLNYTYKKVEMYG